MIDPSKFIAITDLPTLANDNEGSFSFSVPASQVLPIYDSYVATHTHDIVSSPGAITAFSIKHPTITGWVPSSSFAIPLNGTDSIIGATGYICTISSRRLSNTQVSVTVSIFNPGPGTLTTEGVARTVNIAVRTFIPPFA